MDKLEDIQEAFTRVSFFNIFSLIKYTKLLLFQDTTRGKR